MLRPVMVAAIMVSVALAGCSGDAPQPDPDTGQVDKDTYVIEEGKGAISGLLVDDRFRPIHLTDDPQTEFQAKGFVLLQQTGEQVQTTENGEFTFVDLEPGTYTIRVSAEDHEVTPTQAQVAEGVFNEITVLARRVVNLGGVVLTQEYSGFVPCASGGLVAFTVGCTYDRSGDSYRPGPILDYTVYNPDLTYVIIEATSNQAGDMSLVFREDDATGAGGAEYGRADTEDFDAPYMKMILANTQTVTDFDANATADADYPVHGFPNDFEDMESLVFYWGEEPLAEIPAGPFTVPVQGGARLALEFTYVISLFIGPPETDLQTYCILCEGQQTTGT